jgi:uroporphyrinogen III methyltransferase/synthase
LPQLVSDARLTPPAITVIGRSVSLRQTMNWFETRPLFGQTIIVTRTRQQAGALSARLSELGAMVIEAPTIELSPPADWHEVDRALAEAHHYDWVIFTSQNGVTYARQRLNAIDRDARLFGNAKIAAIGDATAQAIRDVLCLHVDLCPAEFVAEALADALAARGQVAGKRFLLLRADIARPQLRERLQAGGAADVRDVAIYETRTAASLPREIFEAIETNQVDWVTFTSSSTAANFTQLLGEGYTQKLSGVKIASIGPITTATLQQLGLNPTVQADTFNMDGLVAGILNASRKG